MLASTYLQINIIPFLALLIMRINAHAHLSYTWRNRVLRFGMQLLMGIISVNTIAWYENGRAGKVAWVLLWIANFCYFLLMEFAAFLSLLYVYDYASNGVGQRGRYVLLPAIPFLLFSIVLFLTPIRPLIFYIDENHCYVRGSLYILHVVVAAGYLCGAGFVAARARRREKNIERRGQLLLLEGFVVFPILGGLLQLCFYGIDVLWPFTTAAMLMIYINVQKVQVTRDELTGLNNRRRLNQYLQELEGRNLEHGQYAVVLIDVDKFKEINDTCGHVVGDKVLKQVAEQMKSVFGNLRAFIARYGGDEFVIITSDIAEPVREEALARLREAVALLHWEDGPAWSVTLSMGVAVCGESGIADVSKLMRLADKRMYEDKRSHHMER